MSLFYNNFARICSERNISPTAVAQKIGLSNSVTTGWKNKGTIPKQEVLEKLSYELECQISDFFKTDYERYEWKRINDLAEERKEEDDNVSDFMFIYNSCNNRQKHLLMTTIYDFEQKVLNS